MQFYCLRCKTKRTVADGSVQVCRIRTKSGTLGATAAKAKCEECGASMSRFVKASDSAKAKACRKSAKKGKKSVKKGKKSVKKGKKSVKKSRK